MNRAPGLGLVLWVATAVTPAWSQTYDVSWWSADGGGAMGVVGGPYVLDATIGQPDAAGPRVAGPYRLDSGFWAITAGGGVLAQADLSVTKTDGAAMAVPGRPVTYTIVTSNAGPTAVTGATVFDAAPAVLASVSWTCSATPGSSCPASGSGSISASVDLIAGGAATFTLTGTIDPSATGTLVNTASIAAPGGVADPNAANNAATDTNTLVPEADLAVGQTDSPDPVAQGASLTYTLQATNLGPSTSPGMTVSQTLPGLVSFVSASPGSPSCSHTSGLVTCSLGSLAPAMVATVTIQVAVSASATGTLVATAAVDGTAIDPASANDTDVEQTQVLLATAESELVHGTRLSADLGGVGTAADQDVYRLRQQPYASYEVVVDATSGDIGSGQGPLLERVAADGTTVLQAAQPVGAGPSRSLRFMNPTGAAIDGELVRVRSASCGSDCGSDDIYRLRAWETTASIPRFNNSATQVTVLMLQSRSHQPIAGALFFWSASGALLHHQPVNLPARGGLVFNTSTVAALAGQGGSVTLAHDGPYGSVAGKGVALEIDTGFSFDSLLVHRPR